MEQLPIQLARLEEKVDAVTNKIDAHHEWEATRHTDQEHRLRKLETHKNVLWGAWAAFIFALKFNFFGVAK